MFLLVTNATCSQDSDCGSGEGCENPGTSSARCSTLVIVVGGLGTRCFIGLFQSPPSPLPLSSLTKSGERYTSPLIMFRFGCLKTWVKWKEGERGVAGNIVEGVGLNMNTIVVWCPLSRKWVLIRFRHFLICKNNNENDNYVDFFRTLSKPGLSNIAWLLTSLGSTDLHQVRWLLPCYKVIGLSVK